MGPKGGHPPVQKNSRAVTTVGFRGRRVVWVNAFVVMMVVSCHRKGQVELDQANPEFTALNCPSRLTAAPTPG